MVVRLAPSVHGVGDHGFVPTLIRGARQHGVAIYVGDGQNCWPAVHVLDAARLYRLALEKGETGACFHGVADAGITVRTIAETIGRRLGVSVASKSAAEAVSLYGFIGHVLGLGGTASSALTRAALGWNPTEPGLLADLAQSHYFEP
jgi:nucleoside-diphosphate-sugar epimerase